MSIKIIALNKKARFDFQIIDTLEAGMVLKGSEVKSLRNGQCVLKDSYVSFRGEEAYLQNAHISVYKASSYNNHEPERLRKLLLHAHELKKLYAMMREKGVSLVPLKIYFKKGMVKIELGVAKGKTKGDKRDTSKMRDASREMAQSLRRAKT
ncbi:MAG: SsrA-binding protein SmpB [Bdellovibrionaceae bacterium]|jgi:SsrA-binding protein|nr:SsrA-binding protein SmpB [Pseudobdellovibrionaceae bacterium]